MGVLEKVSEMKSQGIQEPEIITELRQEGFSPRQINDALGQFQIKNAVSQEPQQMQPPMPMPEDERTTEPAYSPKTQEMNGAYAPPQEEYAPPQDVYSGYPQQEQYYQEPSSAESAGADTMIEIAEQVFAEEIKKIEKKIDKITDTQAILQTKTEYAETRLRKIESIIEKLEVAILERIGSYGHSLETIKKEMAMVEDSFSKIIPHAKAHHTAHHKTKSASAHKKTTKKKTSKKK